MNRAEVAAQLYEAAAALHDEPSGQAFELDRTVDVSHVSGTGVVADGIEATDGLVVLTWHGEHPSVSVWLSMADMLAVHGHGGTTVARRVG